MNEQNGAEFVIQKVIVTQERYRCLTAICSESAGKAFQIIIGMSSTKQTNHANAKPDSTLHFCADVKELADGLE